jgi:FtsZ-binding cell division protein ZapB
MEKLKELYDFLKKSVKNSIEIWDVPNDKKVFEKFRPNLEFFEDFQLEIKSYVEKYETICVQKYVPWGSTDKRKGVSIHISNKKHTDVDRRGPGLNTGSLQHQNQKGMNGSEQPTQGLSYAQMGQLFNYEELKAKKDELQKSCDDLKDKNHALERELDKMTYAGENKPSAIDKLLENPEAITGILSVITQKLQGSPQALNSPALMNTPNNLSNLKKQFIADLVQMEPDDSIVQRMALLMMKYQQGDNSFINEFEKLYTNATS